MPKQVVRPGTWWKIQLRDPQNPGTVYYRLDCENRAQAGYRGSRRRYKRANFLSSPRAVPRRWKLNYYRQGYGGYLFDEIADARRACRTKVIQRWVAKRQGIIEIVQYEGCTYNGLVTSKSLFDRIFPEDMNEMEVLALEAYLGDNTGNLSPPRKREA